MNTPLVISSHIYRCYVYILRYVVVIVNGVVSFICKA